MKTTTIMLTLFMSLSMLSGCNTTTTVVRPTFQETNVPDSLLVCPRIKKSDFPPTNATNEQVHAFIQKIWKNNNMTCATNMEAVKDWLQKHDEAVRKMNAKANAK